MGREKRNLPGAVAGGPKERHRRSQRSQYDPKAPMPEGFVAKPAIPKSKHHSYFEFFQNKDKRKKKLEFEVTTKSTPPPGFEFVPIGNPKLTTACKDLSREKEAMIFVVSAAKEIDPSHLSHHIYRTGHHVRQAIVDEAKASMADLPDFTVVANGVPEPLPESQEEYTAQADASIRDLFPRIPNTDRQAIIVHAFNLASVKQKPLPVGLVRDIPLSRRVQLAVLAHIRHNHTRYDELLKETTWQNARRVVEALCLDILVKWRGDEETGRDQLDEILREVVVISDSEDEDSDSDEGTDDSSIEEATVTGNRQPPVLDGPPPDLRQPLLPFPVQQHQQSLSQVLLPPTYMGSPVQPGPPRRREQRGFRRYRAWEEAIRRNRGDLPEAPYVESARRAPKLGSPSFSSPYQTSGTGPRVLVDGGVVPFQNGFVQNHPRQPGSSVLEPLSNGRLVSPGRHTYEKVTPAVREQPPRPRSHSRHVTPVTNRLQDMLVPSIELRSPENVQPSFVRVLPPRSQPSPIHQPKLCHLDSSHMPRDQRSRDIVYYSQRREVPDRLPQEPPIRNEFGPQNGQLPLSRDRWDPSYRDQENPQRLHFPREQFVQNPGPITADSTRRILLDAPRPGERSNTILMEYRGGFYERVCGLPENRNPWVPETQMGHAILVPREVRHIQEPRRIVSWEEDPRIVRESRADRDVEMTPISTEVRPYHFHGEAPQHRVAYGTQPSNMYDATPIPPPDRLAAYNVLPREGERTAGRYISRQEIHYMEHPHTGVVPNQLPITRRNDTEYNPQLPLGNSRGEPPTNPHSIRRQNDVIILD